MDKMEMITMIVIKYESESESESSGTKDSSFYYNVRMTGMGWSAIKKCAKKTFQVFSS